MATGPGATFPPAPGGARQWTRRATGLTIAACVIVGGACGDSRGANQSEETVPRITLAPTVPTIPPTAATTSTSTTTTTVAATPPPTAPPTPWPTSLRTDPPTSPPLTNPPTVPATSPQLAAATSPPALPAPTQPAVAAPSGPTSTVVVTPSTPRECSTASIGNDTGQLTISGLSCNAGWAIGVLNECAAQCEGRDVFHVTASGWVHDGYFPATCAEGLTGSGMSIYTAAYFMPSFCAGPPGPTDVIRPDSAGERVLQLQTALVAEGYQISVDGTYGPRTQAAVRDFQTRNGLEIDGIAGPQTQAALGIGPNGQAPTAATWPTSLTTTPASATVPSTAVGAGATAECTAAAIGADIGRPVDVIAACHSGWAIGQINNCAVAPCPTVDVFHVTDQGWMYDRKVAAGCAEELHDAGMSAYTAGDFAAWCGVPNLPVQRRVITPGSAGVAVTQLQIALVALGYPIAVDGTYGPGTEAAIRDFQSRNGLGVDGIAGPDTRTALGL